MAIRTEATDDEVQRTNVKPKSESQPVDVKSKINDEQQQVSKSQIDSILNGPSDDVQQLS
jgi:hypothetical protein